MPFPIRRIRRALTTAVIVGTALILPSTAIAQASPAPTAKSMSTKQSTPGSNVEARIKSLHDALKITPAEEAQWQVVADVMRDNAKTTGALIEERTANAKAMTAIDDLHSYEAIAEAHVAGVKKLIPAVDALYANMSDTQKKNADAVFSHRVQRAAAKKSS